MNHSLSPPEDLIRMEDGSSVPIEQYWDSEGEDEINEVEVDILFKAQELAMERDKATEDENEDSGEDSDINKG